ncbi:MAG: hypothetical protein DRO14_00270 [Thermoprotei archaeon]|nr:MAG: hypothetical protein DRO14_00165 [Thermoprotei archaeon]RLG78583.1 MAG: hypothetical protein DRO14_00270 [Thermoprotei archaeon]
MTWISHILIGFFLNDLLLKFSGVCMGLYLVGLVLPDVMEYNHRTIGHSLLLWLPPFVVTYLVFRDVFNYYLPLFVGVVVHIFLDCFSKSGVRIFYPSDFRVRFGLYKTYSWSEWLILGISVVIYWYFKGGFV